MTAPVSTPFTAATWPVVTLNAAGKVTVQVDPIASHREALVTVTTDDVTVLITGTAHQLRRLAGALTDATAKVPR